VIAAITPEIHPGRILMSIFTPAPLVAFLCLFFATSVPTLHAQAEKARKIPFHGKVASVDTTAQTITLAGKKGPRVFHLTSTTKVIDGTGSATTLDSAKVGEDVGGSYAKGADGTMTLFTLRIGAKEGGKSDETPVAPAPPLAPAPGSASPTPAPAPPVASAGHAPVTPMKEKKRHFRGEIVSIDAAAHTLFVQGLTLSVDSDSKLTDATGTTMAFSSLAPGDKVSGSYLKTTGGKLTVATLKKAK
jgi:hypothetical protein